tara:strand:- start:300 stop:746 length:447 start_codon:yes stop_codon:yes gene_type:complete
MPIESKESTVPFTQNQMFDLVSDIDSYDKFLPWCNKSTIISKKPLKDGSFEMIADLEIGYKSLTYTYRSKVFLSADKNYIEVTNIDGPFNHLINKWSFEELPDQKCKINFFINFEIKFKMFNVLISEFFETAFKKMVDSFESRARDIY